MMTLLIITMTWITGYWLAFNMMIVDVESDKKELSVGDRWAITFLSILSFIIVFILAGRGWIKSIPIEYWNKPAKKVQHKEDEVKSKIKK